MEKNEQLLFRSKIINEYLLDEDEVTKLDELKEKYGYTFNQLYDFFKDIDTIDNQVDFLKNDIDDYKNMINRFNNHQEQFKDMHELFGAPAEKMDLDLNYEKHSNTVIDGLLEIKEFIIKNSK